MLPCGRYDARMLLTKMFTCAIAMPSVAGSSRTPMRLSARVAEPERGHQRVPGPKEGGELERQLRAAPDRDAHRDRRDGGVHPAGKRGHRGDPDRVENGRRQRRHEEDPARVERSHDERPETHEQQEGEHDARQQHGEGEFLRVGAEARRDRDDDLGGEQHPERADRPDEDEHERQRRAHEPRRLGPALLRLHPGEHGHECRGHGTLGEQLAQQVRDAESDKKSVRCPRRAEETRERHVPDVAENPADERGGGHHARGLRDPSLAPHGARF